MAVGQRRSRAMLAEGFAAWFAKTQGRDVAVSVTRPPSGLSSETVLLEVHDAALDAAPEGYVARLPPAGSELFPDYDLQRQAAVQRSLAGVVPVAEIVAVEDDPAYVGGPFLLMRRVTGRAIANATDKGGWPYDSGREEQLQLLDAFIGCLAAINSQDPAALGLDDLSGGGPGLAEMLDWWERYLEWATDDAEALAPYVGALAWLRARIPDVTGSTLLWGDPQLTNCIFAGDGSIAAALDWEMTCAGPPEVDLGWFIALQETSYEQTGLTPPAFAEREEIRRRYAAATGREEVDLDWFVTFAYLRSGAIVLRAAQLMREGGMDTGWTSMIPQHRHLQRLQRPQQSSEGRA